nr:PREDICTED: uncharacterized protein LOC109037832 [Bemisia tabaci]
MTDDKGCQPHISDWDLSRHIADSVFRLFGQIGKTEKKKFQPLTVSTNVKIPVPSVDRGKVDTSNVIGVILSVNDGFYKIGTKRGQINSLFSPNQIFECKESFLTPEDVPKGKDISIRSVSLRTSLTGGRGFFYCQCKTKCETNRCKCKKANVLCNSKCHGAMTCSNK